MTQHNEGMSIVEVLAVMDMCAEHIPDGCEVYREQLEQARAAVAALVERFNAVERERDALRRERDAIRVVAEELRALAAKCGEPVVLPEVKEVINAMLEIAPRCDPDWEAQLRDWAERLTERDEAREAQERAETELAYLAATVKIAAARYAAPPSQIHLRCLTKENK